MFQIVSDEFIMQEIYKNLPCSNYSLLSLKIKNIQMLSCVYGKDIVDQILQKIPFLCKQVLQKDEYIFVMNTDTFIFILTSPTQHALYHRILHIDDRLAKIDISDNIYSLTYAIGIFPCSATTSFYQALECADFARTNSDDYHKYTTSYELYDGKKHEQRKSQYNLEGNLEEALLNNEFEVYLQPKLNANTEYVEGAEALIRWFHHGHEIPLSEFMPIINRNAFIRRIDLFVFEKVCSLLKKWKEEQFPLLCISINISKASFEDGEYYVHELHRIYENYKIDKQFIEFELSESIPFEEEQHVQYFVQMIKEQGYTCSLDDFGSGSTSFSSLYSLDVNTVKLDYAFFTKPLTDKKQAFLRDILTTIKNLGFTIVAEGVETAEQAAFLQQSHCDLIQGYYYSKPLSIPSFIAYYKQCNHF